MSSTMYKGMMATALTLGLALDILTWLLLSQGDEVSENMPRTESRVKYSLRTKNPSLFDDDGIHDVEELSLVDFSITIIKVLNKHPGDTLTDDEILTEGLGHHIHAQLPVLVGVKFVELGF